MNIISYECKNVTVHITDYIYLNEDIMNHIMLYCPIHIIRRYLQTCKMSLKLLNDYFWIKKFNHDQLPILYHQFTLKYPVDVYWVKEYIKCYKIIHDSNHLLKKFSSQSDYDKYISVKLSIDDGVEWLDEQFNTKIQKSYQYHHMLLDDDSHAILSIKNHNGIYCINYITYNEDLICFRINMTIENPRNYLQKMMYYLFNYKFKLS